MFSAGHSGERAHHLRVPLQPGTPQQPHHGNNNSNNNNNNKYTIWSIVCEASCLPVIWSCSHPVLLSSGHQVILSSGHPIIMSFQHVHWLTNTHEIRIYRSAWQTINNVINNNNISNNNNNNKVLVLFVLLTNLVYTAVVLPINSLALLRSSFKCCFCLRSKPGSPHV